MNKNSKIKLWQIVLGLAILAVALLVYQAYRTNQPNKLGPFASCLKDKGVIFYGAFWCPHCQNQKKLFGSAAGKLPYVECSTPDGQGQTQVCKDKKIDGYPTWVFPDGSRQSGEVSLEDLSKKSSCLLP